MFTEEGFPSLERKTNAEKQISTKPFIQPTEVLPDGIYKPSSQAEEVLNWQTTNSIAQNNLLKVIKKKVDKLAEDFQYMLNQMSDRIQKAYVETKQKIEALEKDREKAAERSFHENSRKEQELQKLKRQVFEIEDYVKTIAKPPPEDTYTPFPISPKKLITSTIVQYPTKPPFLPPNLPEQTTNFGKRTKKIATTSQTISPEESKDEAEPLDQLMVSFDADSQRSQDSEEEEIEKPSWLTEDVSENASDEEYADLTNILMASNENGEASTSTPGLHTQEINTSLKGISGTHLFSLDDIPPKLWRKRLLDFKSWMDAKMISPDVDRYKVIEEFCARMTGTLKEWYQSIGSTNQDLLHRLDNTDAVISTIHFEFLGNIDVVNKEIRKEYFEMKCCSLKIKDIERHFQRMQQRFYQLNGYNDASLKNTYVSSLPEEIQGEIYRMLNMQNKEITQLTFGEIHQTCLVALDKICNQQQFLEGIIKNQKRYSKTCRKKYLEIKCKKKDCSCKNKSFSKKKDFMKSSKYRKGYKGRRKVKFFKNKSFPRKRKGNKCFICEKKDILQNPVPIKQKNQQDSSRHYK